MGAQTIRAAPNDVRRARMMLRMPPVLPYMHSFSLYAKFCAVLRRRDAICATKMGICGFCIGRGRLSVYFFAIFLGVSGLFVRFCAEKCDFFGFCYACNRHILQILLPIITCKFAARTNELSVVLPSY